MSITRFPEFTQIITPDGKTFDLDGLQSKWILSEEGLGLPQIDYITRSGPFQHGETVIDYRLKPRIIQISIGQKARTRFDYWDFRKELLDTIRPNRTSLATFSPFTLRKRLPNGSLRDINVFIERGPIFQGRDLKHWSETTIEEVLRFVAPDPTFFDPTPIIELFSVTNISHWVLPFAFGINDDLLFGFGAETTVTTTNTGTWLSYPDICLTGPLSDVIITNVTTGEMLNFVGNIASGYAVTISLQYGNKTVTGSDGANLIGRMSDDSDIATFHIEVDPIAVGGVNDITISTQIGVIGESNVEITYNPRYKGI